MKGRRGQRNTAWVRGEPVSVYTAAWRLRVNRKSLTRAAELGYVRGAFEAGTTYYATPDAWREGYEAYLRRPRPQKPKEPQAKTPRKNGTPTPLKSNPLPKPSVDPETARRRLEELTEDQRKALRSFFLKVFREWWQKKHGNKQGVMPE